MFYEIEKQITENNWKHLGRTQAETAQKAAGFAAFVFGAGIFRVKSEDSDELEVFTTRYQTNQ